MNTTNPTTRRIHEIPAGCISNHAMLWSTEGIHSLGFVKLDLWINGKAFEPYLPVQETDIELRKTPIGGLASITTSSGTKRFQRTTPFAWKILN